MSLASEQSYVHYVLEIGIQWLQSSSHESIIGTYLL
jgi:hypothetical protein